MFEIGYANTSELAQSKSVELFSHTIILLNLPQAVRSGAEFPANGACRKHDMLVSSTGGKSNFI